MEKRKLIEMGTLSRGRSQHRPRNDSKLYGGKYPFIQTGDVKNSNLYIEKYSQTYNDFGLNQSKLWPENTLCITIAANIADTGILSFPACFPDSIIGFTATKGKTDVRYVKYCFDLLQKSIQNMSKGSTQDNLSMEKLEQLEFNCPSFENQQKIAAVLSSLDDKIALNNRINAKLEQMAKRLYDYWFVQFDFPNADGKPYKSTGGKMVWNEKLIREIPEGWEVVKIGNLLREEPKSRIQVNEALKMKGTIPFFTSGEDIHLVNDYLTNGSRIFMSTGGNANIKFFDGKTSYSTDTWCLSCDTYIHYCYLFMKTIINYINENLFAGSGLKHLQKEKTKEIYILKPPIDLINKFNALVTISFKKISDSKLENQKIESLRNKLLPLLMNGQVVVE